MKYLIWFMCILIAFSVPFSMLGIYVVPSFSRTLEYFGNGLYIFNNPISRGFISLLSLTSKSPTFKASYYIFNENENIDYAPLNSVYYLVEFPISYELKREHPCYTSLMAIYMDANPNAKKFPPLARYFFAFDSGGSLIKIFVFYKDKLSYSDLQGSDTFKDFLDDFNSSMFSKYTEQAFISLRVNTSFGIEKSDYVVKASLKGSLNDFLFDFKVN